MDVELEKNYKELLKKLYTYDDKKFHVLKTIEGRPFKVIYYNDSIRVIPFTKKATPMTISKEEVDKYLQGNGNYKSYTQILLPYLKKEKSIDDVVIEDEQSLNENIYLYDKKDKSYNLKIKNIMLYGAPGVGKTYNYKRIITMIENGYSENKIFETVKINDDSFDDDETFENIKKDKRIEFVTFHQSYSYEDFIEGFRPNENGDIELDKKGGVFKRITNKAKENLESSQKSLIELEKDINLLDKFKKYVSNKLENEETIKLQKGKLFYLTKFENNKLFFNTSNDSNYFKDFTLEYDDFKKVFESNIEKKSLKNISEILGTNSIQQRYAYILAIYKDFDIYKQKLNVDIGIDKKEEQKNFYIVIDEINRGNISKIFGELITLIEEDKRAIGDKNDYEVTLPYSKEKFKIPSNLYIIATMNSTDKSIATIDIALRRRFTFLKMTPKSELVTNKNAQSLMKNLNNFIKETIGEDYMLGHSYFMSNLDLKFIKEYKIKPLLEEYFYGDEDNYKKAINILGIEENE